MTIPTFSWLQGNPYPGYGILSIGSNMDAKVCFLAPQIYIYVIYVIHLLVCIFLIFTPLFKKRHVENNYIELPRYQMASTHADSFEQIPSLKSQLMMSLDLVIWSVVWHFFFL